MRRLLPALLFLFLAAPVLADACADRFRAGAAVYGRVEQVLSMTEETLYFGLGWVSRARVLNRLESRSAVTSACEEVATLRDGLIRARAQLGDADQAFRLANAFCLGENRRRAGLNLRRIADTARDLDSQVAYLDSLRERCRG